MGLGTFSIAKFTRAAGRVALDLILPPLCLKCHAPVGDPQSVCAPCWSELRFLSAPHCAQCGLPFPHALGEGVKCAACIASPPPFTTLRSAIAYDDASRDLILGFKHADKLESSPLFARWMATAGRDAIGGADALIPIPLHWMRLASRRYNQAAVLAQAIGTLTRVPVNTAALVRTKPTRSQGEMPSPRARAKNVAGAFKLTKKLDGQKLVLVDDVLTTGATIRACAKTLLRGGAASVSAVTLARVLRPLSLSP